jgi:DNA-binding response OmpR family regulator
MSDFRFSPKVIIIDDQALNLKLASAVLHSKGCEVSCISESSEAEKAIREFHPDLILLDIMMPDLDGITLCQRLKSNPETSSIPIIFITAKSGPESLIEGFNAGAVDFVVKPFQTEELLARVKAHVQIHLLQKKLSESLAALEKKQSELNSSMKQVNDLREAMVKICAWTKQIEVDGKWVSIEEYLTSHLGVQLTHGVSDTAAKEILKNL